MRRVFGAAALTVAFLVAGCGGRGAQSGAGFAPTLPSATVAHSSALARGSIIWMRQVTVFTPAQMNGDLGLAGQVISELGGPPKCSVALYAIKYATVGVRGEPTTASAGFFIPQKGCKGPFTLIGYGQGTNVVRAQKITDPTTQNIEPAVLAAIFAAHGYALAATDYLGLGYSNYSYQPYLVASAEASAVIDSMRAVRRASRRLGVKLSGKVFITGYSQGGHTALGTQKAIEAANTGEFDLIGDSPSSGPYALSETIRDGMTHPGQDAAIFSTYIMTGYNKTYGNIYTKPQQVFKSPYASYVDSLLPVDTYAQEAQLAGTTLPLAINALFQPAFMRGLANNPKSPARVDLARNDLLDGWKPVAPLYLCGGSRDPEVEFKNARLAYAYFKAEGAQVKLLNVNPYMPSSIPITEYHDAALVLCHTLERAFVLDAKPGVIAHVGRLHDLMPGRIGPFGI